MKKPLAFLILSGFLIGGLYPSPQSDAFAVADDGKLIVSYDASSLVKKDGTYWIWGGYGMPSVPTQLHGIADAKQALGNRYFSKTDGTLWHWQKSQGSSNDYEMREIEGIREPLEVLEYSESGGRALALDHDGNVFRLNNGKAGAPLYGIDRVKRITSYSDPKFRKDMFVFLKHDGTVWRSDSSFTNFAQATEIEEAAHIDTDGRSSVAADNDGGLWYWDSSSAPLRFKSVKNVKEVYLVNRSILAITQSGDFLQVAIPSEPLKANVSFKRWDTGVTGAVKGENHLILQKADGTLWGWGANDHNELGYGDGWNRLVTVPVHAPIEIVLNGESIPLSNGVMTRYGQSFVPLRSVFEKLGAEVTWDGQAKVATLARDATTTSEPVVMRFNFKTLGVTLNDVPVQLPSPAGVLSSNGSTYLPLRFISEAFGAKVEWVKTDGKILIEMA
jgi:Copper amine oxidase N-terminal domain.